MLRKEEDSSETDRFFQVTLSIGNQDACFTQTGLRSQIQKSPKLFHETMLCYLLYCCYKALLM